MFNCLLVANSFLSFETSIILERNMVKKLMLFWLSFEESIFDAIDILCLANSVRFLIFEQKFYKISYNSVIATTILLL